jgi:hypothetical protein
MGAAGIVPALVWEKLNKNIKKLVKKFGYIKIVCTFALETVNVSTDGAGSSNKKKQLQS